MNIYLIITVGMLLGNFYKFMKTKASIKEILFVSEPGFISGFHLSDTVFPAISWLLTINNSSPN